LWPGYKRAYRPHPRQQGQEDAVQHTTSIAPTHASRVELGQIVEALSAELDLVARRLSDAIHEHLDELDEDLRTWTIQSVRANLGIIVTMLREGTPPSTAEAPPEALTYAKEYVRRGLGLEVLLRAYRTGQKELSRIALDRLRSVTPDAEHRVEAVGFFSDWLFAWVEALERQLTEVYMGEREQWVRGAAAMRTAEVRALLDGSRADLDGVSKRLVYALDRHHVAFLIWSDEADRDAGDAQVLFGAMERRAAEVAQALGAHGWLAVPQGRHLACWAGLHQPVIADRARAVQEGDGGELRVALGLPGHGVEGFCASHAEALRARQVAKLGRARASWTTFNDVALEALATHDLHEARRFVERELGPLAGDDDAVLRLRATLRVFLEEGSSFVRAARRLSVHENTVTYRVRRAEELLGHRAVERQLELRVALRLARLVLPVVVEPAG
jgi:DNA-binding PucR family transcriptional regulator